MLPIASTLKHLLDLKGLSEPMRYQKLILAWDMIVGHEFAPCTKIKSVHHQTLNVYVTNSITLSELGFQKQAIIEKIQEQFGKPYLVTDLRFILSSLKKI